MVSEYSRSIRASNRCFREREHDEALPLKEVIGEAQE